MKRRAGSVPLAAVLISLGLAGCNVPPAAVSGHTPTPNPTSSTKPPGLEPGWSLHRDSGAGFAVAFPDAWVQVQRDSPTLGPDLTAVGQRTPELGHYFQDSLNNGGATGLALLAADPASLSLGYVTNLAVFRSDEGAVSAAIDLDAVTRAKVATLRKDSTIAGSIDQRRLRLGGVEAERLVYSFTSGVRSVGVVAYLLLADVSGERFEYELSMGGAITDYAQLFGRVAATFRLLPPTPPTARPRPSPSR